MSELRALADRLRQIATEIDLLIEEEAGLQRLAKLRRHRPPDLEIELDRADVIWRGRRVKGLTYAQMVIVDALSRRPGMVFSRSELIEAVDPTSRRINDERAIDGYIKRIRRAFEKIDPDFDQIEAVRSLGYRWRA